MRNLSDSLPQTADTLIQTPEPFLVALPGPLDIPASVELFRRNGDDLLDRWDGERLLRTLHIDGEVVPYLSTVEGTREAPALRVWVADARHRQAIEAAALASFIPAPADYGVMLASDPVLAALDAQYPGLRQVRQFDLFAALVRCISAQQVNLRWAATTRKRLAESFGSEHTVAGHSVWSLDVERIAGADVAEIRALQFTTRKAEYIISTAQACADGTLSTETLAELSDDEVIARLTALRGIGLWSAEWILARVLGRPRVVAGDLAVRKAVGQTYLGTLLPPEPEVRRATAHWGEAAGVAQVLVLQSLAGGTGVV